MPNADVRYVSGTGGVSIPLNGPLAYIGTAAKMRGSYWSYDVEHRDLSGVSRDSREAGITAVFDSNAQADLLRRVADRDVEMGTPGSVSCDGWSQRAYIAGVEPKDICPTWHEAELSVVLLDGVWRRAHRVEFTPGVESGTDWLDLPYDLPYDLAGPPARQTLQAGEWGTSPIDLIVYGPCADPYVVIGGNRYQVDVNVPDGGYLHIDGIGHAIRLHDRQGNATDAFGDGVRGLGEGGGEYVFERVPSGESPVSWDNSFGFSAIWYEEDGGIPWER